jgi:chaperone modulatory protein CbpM
MTYALVRVRPQNLGPQTFDLTAFARAAGLHPDLVRRLVALGLIEPDGDAAGRLRFTRAHLAAVARIQRLRAGFALNYAALGLVIDLLDRVAQLEAALGRQRAQRSGTSGQAAEFGPTARSRTAGGSPWT